MQSLLKKVTVCLFVVCCLSTLGWAAPSDPNIIIDPNVVSITVFESGDNPAPTVLTLTNEGGSTSNWSIDTASKPDWIAIAPTSGAVDPNQNESITLTYDISSLASGSYSYAFDIIDPAAENSPQTVTVDLEVIGPVLEVSSNNFLFTWHEGGDNPDDQVLAIENVGGGSLDWSVNLTDKPDWLTVAPTCGSLSQNETDNVTMAVDTTGLIEGLYNYSFDITTLNAVGSPQPVTVSLGGIYVPMTYPTIQAAIDAVEPGDTIIVAPGTYYENVNFNGKDIVLTSINPNDSNLVASTIIDGGGVDSVVTFSGTETVACKLTGFTITNGSSSSGGGIKGNQTLTTITNCTITGNTAGSYGGGLSWCTGEIINCTISDNIANRHGGGLYGCDGSISECVIADNSATGSGGGLNSCEGLISNCMLVGNTAYNGGGLCYCHGTISQCTIVGNTADKYGGGLYDDYPGAISNCIFWANQASNQGDQIFIYGTIPTYSCIQDWTGGGQGNISGDPMFADTTSPDPAQWDLHLLPGSSCIDTGTNTPKGGLQECDIEGNPRPFDGDFDNNPITDMGAFEYVEVTNKPYLHITPSSIFFYVSQSGTATENLTIKNYGSQTLNWSVNLKDKPNWLTVTPANGVLEYNESQELVLLTDPTDLSGTYRYSFEIIDPDAYTSPRIVTVWFANHPVYCVPQTHPTIQSAIDSVPADPNDLNAMATIIVLPGTYYESIQFYGKNIILTSTDPDDPAIVASTIIDGSHNGRVVTFSGDETPQCQLTGFTITNGYLGVFQVSRYIPNLNDGAGINGYGTHATISRCVICNNYADIYEYPDYYYEDYVAISSNGGGIADCDGLIEHCLIKDNQSVAGWWSDYSYGGGLFDCNGTISNCTITGNTAGNYGGGLSGACNNISNCIIWDNDAYSGSEQLSSYCNPAYSCIQDWTGGGEGNITSDPLFADPNNGDCHLQSQYGRWDPEDAKWVYDNLTSPCIDAGDPSYVEWQNELWPHGKRINIGAYGGTAQASMSANPVGNIADLDHDNRVDMNDLMRFSDDWLLEQHLLDTDLNRDGVVNITDFAELAAQWLWAEL